MQTIPAFPALALPFQRPPQESLVQWLLASGAINKREAALVSHRRASLGAGRRNCVF